MFAAVLSYLFVGALCGGFAAAAISKRSPPSWAGGIMLVVCVLFCSYQLFRANQLYTAAARAGSEYALGGTLFLGTALGLILVTLVARVQKLERQVEALQQIDDDED